MAEQVKQRILAQQLVQALYAAGAIAENSNDLRRVIIDMAGYNEAVIIYTERYGDEALLRVVRDLDGLRVETGQADGDDPADFVTDVANPQVAAPSAGQHGTWAEREPADPVQPVPQPGPPAPHDY